MFTPAARMIQLSVNPVTHARSFHTTNGLNPGPLFCDIRYDQAVIRDPYAFIKHLWYWSTDRAFNL